MANDKRAQNVLEQFRKHKGKKVFDVLAQEPGYFGWVLNADFPRYTKKVLTEIRLQGLNTKS